MVRLQWGRRNWSRYTTLNSLNIDINHHVMYHLAYLYVHTHILIYVCVCDTKSRCHTYTFSTGAQPPLKRPLFLTGAEQPCQRLGDEFPRLEIIPLKTLTGWWLSHPSEKTWVSWDDEILNWTNMFKTTNQSSSNYPVSKGFTQCWIIKFKIASRRIS